VECPAHLTEVTGCKLDSQGLPEVAREVKTAEQAAVNTKFRSTTSSGNNMYETTTMEDCCKPSCAVTDWIADKGLATSTKYNAFYSCDKDGQPFLEAE
jgi:hypothetical protein